MHKPEEKEQQKAPQMQQERFLENNKISAALWSADLSIWKKDVVIKSLLHFFVIYTKYQKYSVSCFKNSQERECDGF